MIICIKGLPSVVSGVRLRPEDGQGERPGHRPREGRKVPRQQVQATPLNVKSHMPRLIIFTKYFFFVETSEPRARQILLIYLQKDILLEDLGYLQRNSKKLARSENNVKFTP